MEITGIFKNADLHEFATQDQIKIENGILIFDDSTTNLKFVNLGQYIGENQEYSPFDGLFKIEITGVEFRAEQPNLQYLDLSYQKLGKITIKNCSNLKALYLFNCELAEIVFEGKFNNLQLIDLSKNKLTEVNLQKNNFPALQNFFINANQIKDLSFLAPFIIEDEYFDFGISGNQLLNPPPEIVKEGNDSKGDKYSHRTKN